MIGSRNSTWGVFSKSNQTQGPFIETTTWTPRPSLEAHAVAQHARDPFRRLPIPALQSRRIGPAVYHRSASGGKKGVVPRRHEPVRPSQAGDGSLRVRTQGQTGDAEERGLF